MVIDRWFYLLLVPSAWASRSLLHFCHPGDEYGMYFISSIAGSWIWFLIPAGDLHNLLIPFSVATVGWLVMAGTGWLLYWLKVRKRLCAGLFGCTAPVILLLMVFSFPSVEAALSKNGSWWAYGCSSILLATYAATLLSLFVTATHRLWHRHRAR